MHNLSHAFRNPPQGGTEAGLPASDPGMNNRGPKPNIGEAFAAGVLSAKIGALHSSRAGATEFRNYSR